ncbi:hypothetical protein [Klebsiella aerogenes]|nr:hypothetical protein [Klebsiella aerogenes]
MKKIILPLLTAALLLPTLTAHATYRAEKTPGCSRYPSGCAPEWT